FQAPITIIVEIIRGVAGGVPIGCIITNAEETNVF
ncbi:unnamed protein product, partial [Larinioides sclopetarius]